MANVKFYTGSLDKMQNASAPNIQAGHVYFAVDTSSTGKKGDIYFDANDTTRIKMGAHSDYALKAEGDANSIRETYLIRAEGTGSTTDYKVTTYRGDGAAVHANGTKIETSDTEQYTFRIAGATASAAGLVTTGAQTWAGTKTFGTGAILKISNTAANSFEYSGIQAGSDDTYRPIWFAYAGKNGTPVYDNDFKYNPNKNSLWVNEIRNNTTDNSSTTRLYGTATKVSSSLTFGSKTYDGSTAQSITAADLGLSSALKYVGTSTGSNDTALADEATTNPITLNGQSYQASAGDVVLKGGAEYLWTGSKWELLGDESSYELKGVAQNLINGLDYTDAADDSKYVHSVSETNGKIAVTRKSFSPSISITDGDSNNAPKVNVTVAGNSGTAQALTIASTSKYGVTKLYNGVDSSSTGLAATANAVKIAYDKACAIDSLNNDNAADSSKYVSNVTQSNGLITVSMSSFNPTVTIVDGTSSAAPTVNISVGGNSATAQSITTASTGAYGVTKLTSTIDDSEVLAATPKAVKTVKGIADAAMPKAGGTFTGKVTFNAGMELAKDQIFSVQGGQIKLQSGSSLHSKYEGASIVTAGGISVAETLSAGKVRIDDGLGNATLNTPIGHGCEMIYNSAQACLEFTFN